jgi:alkanesulfonate monooxygenase SsuD/methylene tetrahydromethanopterin reductase-like flavin-dependent oxidoreductase (luciferase family)
VIFGVHTGLQRTSIAELTDLWTRIESLGFDWISIWDHFYAADGTSDPDGLESVVSHAALAATTSRVRCGSLVYSAGFRHPAVLANAMATLDQLAEGRVTLGIGGGWLQREYRAHGIPFGSTGERLRMMEESLICIRLLLTEEVADFQGEFFTLTEARCVPKPMQDRLPIWVGGGGEQVTLRVAAQHADGWNIPYVAPATFAHKCRVLDDHCTRLGREPADILRTVNVGLARSEEDLLAQFGAIAEGARPGVLMGGEQEMIDRVGEYRDAGAQQVNLTLRAPFDRGGLEFFADRILPAFP